MNSLAPIALFAFNRADHLSQTISALQKNNLAKESELFVFCDGPRGEKDLPKINEVHKIIDNISGFKNVVVKKSTLNRGLANSVIAGVNEIINKYGKIIVIEDDIVTNSNFLTFINKSLDFYQNEKQIFSVTGFNYHDYKTSKNYTHDVFFVSRMSSWGWGSWKDRWQNIDFKVTDYHLIKNDKKIQKSFRKNGDNLFEILKNQIDGKIDTWDIQVSWHMFKNKLYCVFPIKTLVKNIGFDASGTHCHNDNHLINFNLENTSHEITLVNLENSTNNNSAKQKFLKYTDHSFFKKLIFSHKKRIRLKYIILGIIIAELVRTVINLF